MTVILVEQIELSLNTCFYSLFRNLISLNAYIDFLPSLLHLVFVISISPWSYSNLTYNVELTEQRNNNLKNASIDPTVRLFLKLVIDEEEPMPLWLFYQRTGSPKFYKKAESTSHWSKFISSTPIWPLHHLLPPDSCPCLNTCPGFH